MLAPASSIDLDSVDREIIKRSRGMRFAPEVERAYLQSYIDTRAPLVPIWASIGTLLYCMAALGDQDMMRANAELLLMLRFGVFLPYGLAVIAIMHFWPRPRIYEALSIGVALLGTFLPMSVLAITPSPYAYMYQSGTVSTLLFLVVLLRPRFYAALIGVFGILAIQFSAVYINGTFDSVAFAGVVTSFLTLGVFLLLAAHWMEQGERRSFLQRLRNDILTERLRFQSEHDELTSLRNRRSLGAEMARIWHGADRGRQVVAIMLDIDHFKLYNDVHGHIAGDACIRTVSQIMAETLRDRGHTFRYGGEELLAILPDATLEEALVLAEDIRACIVAAHLPHEGLGPDQGGLVTASIGVAAMRPRDGSPERLLSDADAALYRAKGNGRNQVHPKAA